LPFIECYPSKLNQVFLNLITKAIHAVDEKFQGKPGGEIRINTYCDDENVFIRVADNGIGIREDLRSKIFDPFFTTKDVREGTGLGLAIVSQTVSKHHGEINLISEEGKGCEFIIKLPITQAKITKNPNELIGENPDAMHVS